jgi:SNF2 family DNA or RNA helicase
METAYSNVQAYLENLPEETDIPSELKTSLLRHQKQALRWLVRQEHRWQCAILADDMGLGKTIQTLALIAKKRENPTLVVCPVSTLWHWNDEIERHFKPGTFSVSIYYGSSRVRDPKVLRRQDVVLTTYGTLQSDLKVEVKSTTTQYAPLCLSDQDEFDSNSGPSKSTSVLKSVKWGRIVLDEAHLIKNHNTSTAKAVRQLDARTRICLTGTPIQNSLDDLYSLLLFLRYPDYLTYKDWKNDVVVPVRARKPQGLVRLQQVLRHLLLRRRKNQMLNGKPIIEIPEIRVNVELITMNEHETLFYRAAEQQSRDLFLQMLEQGESHVRSNYWHVLELLLRLRQACDHPFLVLVGMLHTKLDRRSLKTWNVPLLEDTFRNFVREFRAGNGATLNSFVESFQSTGSSSKMAEMCAICFEDLECPIISTKCQHVYCKSCIDDHMESETTCPACSAVLHPRDLRPLHEAKVLVSQAASTNSAVSAATPLLVPVLPRHLEPSSPTRLTLTVESWKDQNMHVQPNTSLLGESTPPATEVPPAFKTRVKFASSPEADLPSSSPPPPMSPLSPGFPSSSPPSEFGDFKKTFKVVKPPSDSVSPRQTPILNAAQTASSLPTAVSRNVVRPGLFVPVIAGGKDQPVLPSRVPTAPKIPAPIVANTQPITPDEAPTSGPFSNATAAAAPDDNKPPDSVVEQPASPAPPSKLRDRGTQTPTTEAGAGFRSSTKLDHLIRYLQEHTVTEKAVVYSQFVCYLDLVEAKMRAAGLVFVRLDGSMSAKERQDVIRRLGEDKRVRIMLVSLRAGGLGINLTAASRVILLDPWWNPATEQQAIDRVHRIGQIRPVHVVKYIFTDTIEERILKLQQHKQAVADAALADKDTTASGTMLSVSDLRQLFRVQM